MRKIILGLTVLLMFLSNTAEAQQDPQYTMYMYNQAVLNPAYAGSTGHLSIMGLYRDQWSGFEGAPKTLTFSGHTPVGKNVGLGLSFISDQHGPVKENNIYADFSYTVQLGETTKLAFGAKGGVTLHDIALSSGVTTQVPGDPFFAQDVNSATPNVGLGTFLYGEKYYVGLSVPNLLNSVHLDENGRKYGSEIQHYFVTAGYVFQVTPNTKFKPSFMVKSSFESPISYDINANFLFYDRFELGASYRAEDSFSGLVNFGITRNLRIGYAYDHILTDINIAAKASHEIILLFDVDFPKKVSRSPRFF